ncbi:MAG TPA: hypothetical protein VMG12_05755 [Polyangiaceae bacterium]|nr:hypothetical protein [Polyangiaceae bacterium]
MCWAAALIGGAACGSPPPAEHVEIDNSFNITIYTRADRRAAPAAIDPTDPRIAAAERELTQLLGHPLAFDVQAAAAAKFGQGLHQAYISALEEAVTSLDECRSSQPGAFALGAPQLERIRVQYEPVHGSSYVAPRLEEGTLSTTLYPDSLALFDGSGLCSAFEQKLSAQRHGRFTGVEASSVAERDQADYVGYLFDRGEGVLEQLDTIRLMADLEPRLVDPALREKVTRSVAYHGSTLNRLFRENSADARVITALGKAQRSWITWVNRRGTSLAEGPLKDVIDALFLDEGQRPTSRELRRGFDSTAFASPIIEDFVANVAHEDTGSTEKRTWMFVVCRAKHGMYHTLLEVSKVCNGAFYGDLVATPAGRQKLSALLIAKHHDLLTQTAIAHALRTHGPEAAIELVERLRRDERTLHVALNALADFYGWRAPGTAEHPDPVHPRALLDRIPSWWKSMPAQRSTLLHIMIGTSGQGKEKLPWPKLAEFLGARIDQPTLAAFLADRSEALDDAPLLMPSLSPGWSRSGVIVPALERWLDAQAAGSLGDANPSNAATSAANALCKSGIDADFDDLQRALRQRAKRYPAQMKRLASFYEESRTQVCPYERPEDRAVENAAGPRRRAAERVSFGD